ncbi:MAG: L,D-transpeptidase family protein [Campylobacterota bacterium]|nr:L,D-transpeptidase family protein [Campylobacterota bacterium]
MYLYKRLSIFIILSTMLLSNIYAPTARESLILKQFDQIDKEQQDIFDMLSEENHRIEMVKAEEQRRLEAIALAKYLADEEQRLIDEKIALQREKKNRERLEVLRLEQKKLRVKRVAAVKRAKERRITAQVDLSQQKMRVYRGDKLIYTWLVSTARRGYVTPVGNYQPQFIEKMHYSRLYNNSPMPYSVFYNGNYAIHGTNSTGRLGRRASHGCVRLHPKNAKKLYHLVAKYGKKNTFIKIKY